MIENSDIVEDDNIVYTRSNDGISYHYYDVKNNISDITSMVNENILSKKKIIISNMKENIKF